MGEIAVQVASREEEQGIQLVASYARIEGISFRQGPTLLLQAGPSGQDQLTGLNTICRYIASLSARRDELLGGSETSRAQILGWLSFKNVGLSPITEDKLAQISQHLLTRMYLVDGLSLADLCLFAKLHRALARLPTAQAMRYCSLIRWFDHIQHTADLDSIYKKVHFAKPGLPPFPNPSAKASEPAKTTQAGPAVTSSVTGSKEISGKPAPLNTSTEPNQAPKAQPVEGSATSEAQNSGSKDAKQAKKDARKEARKTAEPKKSEEARIDMLDLRVGKIVNVGPHPNADALYVEDIDVGEDKPRQVVSGLRKFVAEDQMLNRRVIVALNLKPAKMRDVMSYGMVLCASNGAHDKVDPLTPPEDAKIGERVSFSGYAEEPEPEINPKKKILEKLKEDLQTDSVGVATYKSVPFMCAGSPVISTIPHGHVG